MKISACKDPRAILILLSVILACAALANATSPKLELTWKNPDYNGVGSFTNIMVLALNGKVGSRAQFEDDMVAAISKIGIKAQPSYEFLPRPEATPIDVDNLRWVVRKQGFDAIIVSRLTKQDSTTVYVPGEVYTPMPFFGTFYGYYEALAPVIYSPGYLSTDKVAQVETNFYSTSTPDGQLVWTGTTNVFNANSVMSVIKDLAKVTVKELEKQNVLRRTH
jgi:hypothetical protein